MSHSWNLQTAVYAEVLGVSIPGVKSIIDNPNTNPSESDYPFVEISDSQIIPNDASQEDGSTDEGFDEFIDIHVWSRYRGMKEVKEIQGAIYDALHHQSLTVTGRDSAFIWLDGQRVIDDPDGLTRHGIQTFKITHRSFKDGF